MKIHDRAIGPGGKELTFIKEDPNEPGKGLLNIQIDGTVVATDVNIKDAQGNQAKITPTGEQLVQLTGSIVKQKAVVIANAVAITDTNPKLYNLIGNGGLTEEEIRTYRRFKISFNNTHDQAASVRVATVAKAVNVAGYNVVGDLYNESGVLKANNGRLIIQSKEGGVGANSDIKTVPALEGLHSNLFVRVDFSVAPTSGSITIIVEMSE